MPEPARDPPRLAGPGVIARRATAWLTWWVLLMSLWVILDDSTETDELLAGAGAAALGAFLAEFVSYQAGTRFRLRSPWLAPALRLPAQVVRDTRAVFGALWRLAARGEQPASGFRELPVRYGGDTTRDMTRRVLLTGGRSFTPNAFVLGLDRARGVMVVHELVPPGGPEAASEGAGADARTGTDWPGGAGRREGEGQ